MATYRVYRVGEPEPVRVAGAARPLGRRARAKGAGRASGRLRAFAWAVFAVAVAAGAALFWLYGREVPADALAAADLARLSGRVPSWAMLAAPVAGVLVVGLSTLYLAFGRRTAVKVVGLAAVVALLATPGLALGWASGTVATVSDRTPQVHAKVVETEKQLRPRLPGKPVNILLLGSDRTDDPEDPGRSDTQMLVRLDPETKSIAMFSLPRDLRILIPGVGYDKMNTAYSYGGPALAVETFTAVTGLPINHFIEVDFAGFWHSVNILGGVYIPVDRRYYNPRGTGYKSIDIEPGYQLLKGKDSLDYVRFRHDQKGDFTRMQRQQLYLTEMQRQSSRWSSDWDKVVRLIRALTKQTTSDIDSLGRIKPLVELIFQVDTSQVSSVHLESATTMIDGISYVVAGPYEIQQAVEEFTSPPQAPVKTKDIKIAKKMYPVSVYNGSGIPGLATTAAEQLRGLGYRADAVADAPEYPDRVTAVYTPRSLVKQARQIAALLWPSDVRVVERAPGSREGIGIFVASSFTGTLNIPEEEEQPQQTLLEDQLYDLDGWRALAAKTPLRLEMPAAWSPGLVYDEFRAYSVEHAKGKRSAAAVAVVRTPAGGYATIQALRWLKPPAIAHPSSTRKVKGTEYLLFYEGSRLHTVAWERKRTLYWVMNTIDNELSNDLMMGLATSFTPVK